MPTLKTGFVPVSGYAVKVRKTLFAQNSGLVKESEEWGKAIAFGVAVLNINLYKLLVEELGLSKHDIVRVQIDYSLDYEKKAVVYDWNSLTVEIYKKMPEESFADKVEKFKKKAGIPGGPILQYTVAKAGETLSGDSVYLIKLDDQEIGIAVVFVIDEATAMLKRAVLLNPPALIGKTKLDTSAASVEQRLSEIVEAARNEGLGAHLKPDEAKKLFDSLKASIVF